MTTPAKKTSKKKQQLAELVKELGQFKHTEQTQLMMAAMLKESGETQSALVRLAIRLLFTVRAKRRDGWRTCFKRGVSMREVVFVDDVLSAAEIAFLDTALE